MIFTWLGSSSKCDVSLGCSITWPCKILEITNSSIEGSGMN